MELARFVITVARRWKVGCKRDSCAMRGSGRQDGEFCMTTSEYKVTALALDKVLDPPVNDNQDDALVALAHALEVNSRQPQIYAQRAAVWQSKGDTRRAVADCDAAISLDPGNAAYHRMRGNLRTMQADLDGAMGDFDAAIALDPTFAAAYVDRGMARFLRTDVAGALAD